MIESINPKYIITTHIGTLINYETKKVSYRDHILFFIIPFILGFFFLFLFKELSQNLSNILITIYSIFIGLLLNLLLLTYELVKEFTPKDKNLNLKKRFLQEIFANISYNVFISICLIFFLLVGFINFKYYLFGFINLEYIPYISAFFVYFLSINFFLTLLLILKRIHIFLYEEFGK